MATTQKVKILFHCDESEPVADLINGALIILPPNEPVELDEFIANAVLDHKAEIHGIVEVNATKTKTGVVYDIDEAIPRAMEALERAELATINFYVRQQMEDRIAGGKQPLPPNGRALGIIRKRKVSLRNEYGIVPVGWKDPGVDTPYAGMSGDVTPVSQNTALTTQVAILQQSNAELKLHNEQLGNQFAALMKKFEQLMGEDGTEPEAVEVQAQAGQAQAQA